MSIKIGINGFGRIGRLVFRAAVAQPETFEVVGINDPFISPDYMVYMVKYDTMHGHFQGKVESKDGKLVVNGHAVSVYAEKDPSQIPWGKIGVEYVVESTGVFPSTEKASAHLSAGAKKVVISAPAKDDTPTFVCGVNLDMYRKDMKVVSNASCTTNCLAPIVKVLHEQFHIVRGLMTTVHSYTNDQAILEKAHKKDPRRGRAAAENIIPTSTGAAKAIGIVIPEMKGKLNGLAIRVPTPDVSLVDLVVELEKTVTKEEVNEALKKAAEDELKGILAYTDEPLVSSDFRTTNVSSTVDSLLTMVMDGNLVKVIAWYDNEWGYSMRIIDLVAYVASKGL